MLVKYVKMGTNLIKEDRIECVQAGQDKEGNKLLVVRLMGGHNVVLKTDNDEEIDSALDALLNLFNQVDQDKDFEDE